MTKIIAISALLLCGCSRVPSVQYAAGFYYIQPTDTPKEGEIQVDGGPCSCPSGLPEGAICHQIVWKKIPKK